MKREHTPGPWTVHLRRIYGPQDERSRHPNGRILIGGVADDRSGWESPFGGRPEDMPEPDAEAEANAILIAAAPDLLEALESVTEYARSYLFALTDHDAAHRDHFRAQLEAWLERADQAMAKASGQ